MTQRFPTCTGEENHIWSLGQFVALLMRHDPQSVLDVGCGSGRLLQIVTERGVRATGIDRASPRLDALRDAGFDVREASDYELPFEDRSFEWVTLRHVPHHLVHPERTIAESLRVARIGILVAEPAFEPSLASQRTAERLDLLEKRLDRRTGMHHAPVHGIDDLLAMLPDPSAVAVEVESHRFLRLRGRSVAEVAASAEPRVAALPEDDRERVAFADLLADCERDGLSWNGSLCLSVVHRSTD